jgi:hypothetical protein
LKKSKSRDGAARDAIGNGQAAANKAAVTISLVRHAFMRILP